MAIEQQTSYNADTIIAGWIRDWAGQRLTITNRVVSKLAFILHKEGIPTGDVTFQIRRISGDGLIMEKVWGSAAGLPAEGSEAWVEVTFDTPTLINEEVSIRVSYPTSFSNYRVNLHFQSTDVKASEYLTFDGGTAPSADAAYRYTYTVGATATVTTQAVTSITSTTATGNGNVTDLGDASVTQHGHCWDITFDPTTSTGSGFWGKTENGAAAATGAFTSSLTDLLPKIHYYVRAYATNSAGTSYGQLVTFTAGAAGSGEESGGAGSELAGLYAVVEESFHYVDAYGTERQLWGEPV